MLFDVETENQKEEAEEEEEKAEREVTKTRKIRNQLSVTHCRKNKGSLFQIESVTIFSYSKYPTRITLEEFI